MAIARIYFADNYSKSCRLILIKFLNGCDVSLATNYFVLDNDPCSGILVEYLPLRDRGIVAILRQTP